MMLILFLKSLIRTGCLNDIWLKMVVDARVSRIQLVGTTNFVAIRSREMHICITTFQSPSRSNRNYKLNPEGLDSAHAQIEETATS
jgi:hypothetical protein